METLGEFVTKAKERKSWADKLAAEWGCWEAVGMEEAWGHFVKEVREAVGWLDNLEAEGRVFLSVKIQCPYFSARSEVSLLLIGFCQMTLGLTYWSDGSYAVDLSEAGKLPNDLKGATEQIQAAFDLFCKKRRTLHEIGKKALTDWKG